MTHAEPDLPEPTAAAIQLRTGRSRETWRARLDAAGAHDAGRPTLVLHLSDQAELDERWASIRPHAAGDAATIARIRPRKSPWTNREGTLESDTAVEVPFADKGKTGITLDHTRIPWRREADRVRAVWSPAIEELRTLLERRRPCAAR